MANVIFKTGVKSAFQTLEQKDVNTLYWLTDTNEIYKGDVLFGSGRAATETDAGLMSPEDKAKLDSITSGTVSGLTPVDASIIIADGTIGVQVSQVAGNILKIESDGLYAAGAEYAMKKLDEATDGYAASYQLQKTTNGETTLVGDVVNIPKDLVLQSGSLKTVETADQPYAGAVVGDPYIDLILNDADSSHIYVPMKGIIDTSKFVVQEIESTNGTALIQNESTGGGAKFWHTDGTESFVGVNDGGENGMVAQIYADKMVDGNWVGSRINVYRKGIFYHNMEDKASGDYVADDPNHEIATKGDISAVEATVSAISESLVWGSL